MRVSNQTTNRAIESIQNGTPTAKCRYKSADAADKVRTAMECRYLTTHGPGVIHNPRYRRSPVFSWTDAIKTAQQIARHLSITPFPQ